MTLKTEYLLCLCSLPSQMKAKKSRMMRSVVTQARQIVTALLILAATILSIVNLQECSHVLNKVALRPLSDIQLW
jgi:hypothetical protein